MKFFLRPLCTAVLLSGLLSSAAWASAEPVGFVKTVSGKADIVTGGKSVTAAVGAPVFQGSSLRTGPASALGVTFRDNTVMSFGPDTELTVDEYLYQPTQNQGRLGTRISKGTLNYVSGAIARVRPDAVSVTTPTGTIGVRGTQFLLKVD